MMRYAEFLQEDLRLVTLRILSEMPGYRSNSSILFTALGQYGHSPSRDMVKTQLHWLAEQSLITVDNVNDVLVVTLTGRGADVAAGRAVVPGVKRPGAGG